MNIKDVDSVPHAENKLLAIFNRQKELIEKYQEIEGIPAFPFTIDDHNAQVWIKDFLWRTAEELAESLEAEEHGNFEHQVEELSDALHFLAEAIILAGAEESIFKVTLEDWVESAIPFKDSKISYLYLDCFKWLGLVGNTLKNKKWKQTQMPTDLERFNDTLTQSWIALITIFVALGLSAEDIYNVYFKKSEVNKFRQRTNY